MGDSSTVCSLFWVAKLNNSHILQCIKNKEYWGRCKCNQKRIIKCLKKLPKNEFTRKMIDFNSFTKLPKNVGDLGKSIIAKGFKKLPKVQ